MSANGGAVTANHMRLETARKLGKRGPPSQLLWSSRLAPPGVLSTTYAFDHVSAHHLQTHLQEAQSRASVSDAVSGSAMCCPEALWLGLDIAS